MRVKVRRNAVDVREWQWPGYLADVQAIATEISDTHYTVPSDAYLALWQRYSATKPRPSGSRRKPIALGDAVERMLTRLGITKERVQAWTRRPCNCPARQRWLNQWGYAKQAQLERVLRKAARWYGVS